MISRRMLSGALLAAPVLPARAADRQATLRQGLSALERRHGGRLGVALFDTAGAEPLAQRGEERFPMASTFKFLAAACALARVDRQEESLGRRIIYGREALVPYSPVTGPHAGAAGMTVAELCDAAVTLSDNTAGNLLLASFGGPAGLTGWLRSLGDEFTRLDRWETALNEATPGDPRDTTTPLAMLGLMRRLLVEDTLSADSCAQLTAWLVACRTGDKRLRAGVPKGWRAGDKTGSGGHNTTNDIAILWPPSRPPILVAAYYTGAQASDEERNAVLAEVGRLAAG
ncbi:class A beta-lactamase [Siccirubricoccus deserti]|uniref:beta-lactamase n=1 Tax=Siccirubricoccus deserti TaxID=2013562 RepID=A0A9X0UFH4_9PROT|nr:class A beta-lactamase [Siccirubricoccus deserti]MBC4017878.1 class A beta-lactamase [Siccirubricoccus deserti]